MSCKSLYTLASPAEQSNLGAVHFSVMMQTATYSAEGNRRKRGFAEVNVVLGPWVKWGLPQGTGHGAARDECSAECDCLAFVAGSNSDTAIFCQPFVRASPLESSRLINSPDHNHGKASTRRVLHGSAGGA
jgi:hypothetical protein